MKSTIKFFLIVALFVSNAFADGDMGSGGITGDMGSGGIICDPTVTVCPMPNPPTGAANTDSTDEDAEATDSGDTIFDIVDNYLNTIFG